MAASFTPQVLVADPNPESLLLWTATYESAGCSVRAVHDGVEALERALVAAPHLLVTEMRLPRIDGASLCRILRSDSATRTLPLIIITDDSEPQAVRQARSVADALFLKPVAHDELLLESHRLIAATRELIETSKRSRNASKRIIEESRRLQNQSNAACEAAEAVVRQSRMELSEKTTVTANPPTPAPLLRCPRCSATLMYRHTYLTKMRWGADERWDVFTCRHQHGTFEYRYRTRRLRRIGDAKD